MNMATGGLSGQKPKKNNTLSPEDLNWVPNHADVAATEVALGEFFSERTQTIDTVPWNRDSWRFILPRACHFTKVWQIRQPHEKTSSGQARRTTDYYVVNLKKHLLEEIFNCFDGEIMNHLRNVADETDVIRRAAVQRKRERLSALSEQDRRAELRSDTGQWLTNCTKSTQGPRWLQAYNKAYCRSKEPVTDGPADAALNMQNAEHEDSGPLYRGRANSAKELFSQTQPFKSDVMARAARLIVDSTGEEAADIRQWRRALDEAWAEQEEEVKHRFIAQAASLALRINRGYQQVDRVFSDLVSAARHIQAIDEAFGAIVIETRKWIPVSKKWDAVRYVLTTIPSKSSKKLQSTWDFGTYDQKITDWCDSRRLEHESDLQSRHWLPTDENGGLHDLNGLNEVVPPGPTPEDPVSPERQAAVVRMPLPQSVAVLPSPVHQLVPEPPEREESLSDTTIFDVPPQDMEGINGTVPPSRPVLGVEPTQNNSTIEDQAEGVTDTSQRASHPARMFNISLAVDRGSMSTDAAVGHERRATRSSAARQDDKKRKRDAETEIATAKVGTSPKRLRSGGSKPPRAIETPRRSTRAKK